jgi:hypothetical protein
VRSQRQLFLLSDDSQAWSYLTVFTRAAHRAEQQDRNYSDTAITRRKKGEEERKNAKKSYRVYRYEDGD